MVSRTTIEEANKHLHAMHLHSTYLENSLDECRAIMKQNEERYCSQITNLRKEKDEKIKELSAKLKSMEDEKRTMEKHLNEKENEIRLLKGRLSVFNQIFQFLPGLRSFVGVIENAKQLVKDNDNLTGPISNDPAIKAMNMSVPSIAKHNITNEKVRTLSVSEDSEDEILQKDIKNSKPNGTVKSHKEKMLLAEKTAEVFL